MKHPIKTLSRMVAIAAMAGVLFSPMIVGEAMAQVSNPGVSPQCQDCINSVIGGTNNYINGNPGVTGTVPQGYHAANCVVGPVNPNCVGNGQQADLCPGNDGVTYSVCWAPGAPEMSDYLAVAFIVMASGMIYHFRRRALAAA